MNQQMIETVVKIARQAGDLIMNHYEHYTPEQAVRKDDGSPLTKADQDAHTYIASELGRNFEYPMVSEESELSPERLTWSTYWLVDPLDGTKEFLKKNGEFTVNIALIKNS